MLVLVRLYSVRGRFSRENFLWTVLAFFISFVALGVITAWLLPSTSGTSLASWLIYTPWILFLCSMPILVCAYIKRLHDFAASGWWFALILVPIVIYGSPQLRSQLQGIVMLGLFSVCLLTPSTKGANKYGKPEPTNKYDEAKPTPPSEHC